MRRQDLLDERRAGAGHADDEHRQFLFRMSRLGQRLPRPLKRLGGEARNEAVVPCGQRRAIEARRHRPQPVCLLVMPHSHCVIAQIVVGLTQSEVNGDARQCVETWPLGEASHAIHQRAVGLRHTLHRGQLLERGREILDRQGEMARRLLEHPAVR